MLVPGSVAATVEGSYARVQQAYDLKLILVLASVVCAELLVIGWLLHTRWKARSAEASLQRNEEELTAAEEKSSKAARAEFGGRLIQAQEQERTRIARELHDDINQRLALLANGMERVIQANGDYTKAEQTKQLRELSQLTNEIATDIQHLSHQLHPSKLHYLGLAAAVRDLCREFSRQHGIGVECNVEDLPRDLDDGVSLSLFRTLQESLRNVARHSGAREVKVELIYDSAIADSAVVKLRIDDDGIGFDPRQSKNSTGLGLVSMGERLRSVGGQFSLWSRPGNGTRVEGTVPAILKRNRSAPTPVELMSPRQF
jgi:signal transduction histidine kinase